MQALQEAYFAQGDKGLRAVSVILFLLSFMCGSGFLSFEGCLESKASSSNGRASDSKSEGWGFKSLLACQIFGGGFS